MAVNDCITILLVEDNEIDVMAIRRAFKKKGISNPFVVAKNGIEAFEFLRGTGGRETLRQPFVILLDLNMPQMNGFEFLEQLRADPKLKHCIVMVLTTSESDRDKTETYDRNVAGYLSKIDAGTDFLNVIQLVEQFQISVHFPPNPPDDDDDE